MQGITNLVVLISSRKMLKNGIWMQKSASMQKRTSPLKFGDLAEKSRLNSVSDLSTKVRPPGRSCGASGMCPIEEGWRPRRGRAAPGGFPRLLI